MTDRSKYTLNHSADASNKVELPFGACLGVGRVKLPTYCIEQRVNLPFPSNALPVSLRNDSSIPSASFLILFPHCLLGPLSHRSSASQTVLFVFARTNFLHVLFVGNHQLLLIIKRRGLFPKHCINARVCLPIYY